MPSKPLRAARYKFEQVLSAQLAPAEMRRLKADLLTQVFVERVLPSLEPLAAIVLVVEPWQVVNKPGIVFPYLQGVLGVRVSQLDPHELTAVPDDAALTRAEFAETWGLHIFPTRELAIDVASTLRVAGHEVWVIYFESKRTFALMLREVVTEMVAREFLGPQNVVWTPPGAAPWQEPVHDN